MAVSYVGSLSSIHEVTSFACGKPRIWLIFAFVSILLYMK